jgi:hypothetical protein
MASYEEHLISSALDLVVNKLTEKFNSGQEDTELTQRVEIVLGALTSSMQDAGYMNREHSCKESPAVALLVLGTAVQEGHVSHSDAALYAFYLGRRYAVAPVAQAETKKTRKKRV